MEIRNAKTFEYFNKFIKDGDSILDVGCRDGELNEYLKGKKDINYTGIDPCASQNSRFIKSTIEEYESQGEKFDIISMSHVLEHTKSPFLALEKSKEFLKPKGKILMAVPNIYTFKFLQVIPFNLKNYPKGNSGHYQEFTKMEIGNLCRDLKLKITHYKPQGFECVLIKLPWGLQKILSKIFPWMSTELNFILEKDNDQTSNK